VTRLICAENVTKIKHIINNSKGDFKTIEPVLDASKILVCIRNSIDFADVPIFSNLCMLSEGTIFDKINKSKMRDDLKSNIARGKRRDLGTIGCLLCRN